MTEVPASAARGSGKPAPSGRMGGVAVHHVSLWNVANLLTMTRLLLVPGFIALMLAGGGYDPAWRSLAWAAFAIAMITDLFDGHLARTYNLVTDFGKIADPIADKAIMGAALICLSALGDLPWWVTGVILGRELGITLLRFLVIRYGVIPASRGGKLKTLAQGIAVGMYVLALTGPLATLRFWVMAVAVALTVITGLDYVKRAVELRRQGRRGAPGVPRAADAAEHGADGAADHGAVGAGEHGALGEDGAHVAAAGEGRDLDTETDTDNTRRTGNTKKTHNTDNTGNADSTDNAYIPNNATGAAEEPAAGEVTAGGVAAGGVPAEERHVDGRGDAAFDGEAVARQRHGQERQR